MDLNEESLRSVLQQFETEVNQNPKRYFVHTHYIPIVTISDEAMDALLEAHPDLRGVPTLQSADGRLFPKPLA